MSVSGRIPAMPPPAPFVGVLDSLGLTATAAYSMRRLSGSYVANRAVNVRRASDNGTLDVGFIGINQDLDVPTLTAFLAATSGFDAVLYDQSGGTSFDFVQGTAANQPGITLSEATLNNRPALTFLAASSQSMARATTPVIPQPFTMSLVAERTAAFTTAMTIFGLGGIDAQFGFHSAANTVKAFFGTTGTTATANDSIAHTLVAVGNGASSKYAVDGAISGLSNFGASNGPGGLLLGNKFLGGAFLTGFVGEVIIFSSALSDANITALQANQKAYWGTP